MFEASREIVQAFAERGGSLAEIGQQALAVAVWAPLQGVVEGVNLQLTLVDIMAGLMGIQVGAPPAH